jgi:hypothetical protein
MKKGGIDTQSCYKVWHTVVDLMEERHKYRKRAEVSFKAEE